MAHPEDRRIRFGEEEVALDLPRGELAAWIEPTTDAPDDPAEAVVRRALDEPIGSPRLRDLARGRRSAAILVPGQDRVAAVDRYLPLLIEELGTAGVPLDGIEVFLATGTHAKHTPAEVERLLGDGVVRQVRWREHDCYDRAALAHLGATSRGTPIWLHRDVLAADVKVLTGRIIPHYFAGFGGGRKALLPGVAGFDTIVENHRLALHPERGMATHVAPCSLEGNPVHLDMLEAAQRVEGTFVLNTLLDARHRVIGAVAGETEAAHEAGCAEVLRQFQVALDAPLDAAIVSAGGAPYDCNFIQALKAPCDTEGIVRPGGALLWIAQCPQGMREGFLRRADLPDDALESAVRADYRHADLNWILLRRLVRRLRVALWSDLPAASVRAVGIEPVASLEEGVDWLLKACPARFRYGVVPSANITHATLSV